MKYVVCFGHREWKQMKTYSIDQMGCLRGAVVRVAVQRSDDPYVTGSNPTVRGGVTPSDETL
jgi:hypothetical protein